MTRGETLSESLLNWRPTGPGPHVYCGELGDGLSAGLTAERTDEFSALLLELSVTGGAEFPILSHDLIARATGMANRVTALAEPLIVYEVDAEAGIALLRSAKSSRRGDDTYYFEMKLTGHHSASLKRYRAGQVGSGRQAAPFALTHEAIGKTVSEIIGEGLCEVPY